MPCEIHVALFSASPQSFQLLLKLLQLALHCLRVNLERCAERKAERRGVLDEMRRPGGRGRRLDHLLHLTVDEMRTVTHVRSKVGAQRAFGFVVDKFVEQRLRGLVDHRGLASRNHSPCEAGLDGRAGRRGFCRRHRSNGDTNRASRKDGGAHVEALGEADNGEHGGRETMSATVGSLPLSSAFTLLAATSQHQSRNK